MSYLCDGKEDIDPSCDHKQEGQGPEGVGVAVAPSEYGMSDDEEEDCCSCSCQNRGKKPGEENCCGNNKYFTIWVSETHPMHHLIP